MSRASGCSALPDQTLQTDACPWSARLAAGVLATVDAGEPVMTLVANRCSPTRSVTAMTDTNAATRTGYTQRRVLMTMLCRGHGAASVPVPAATVQAAGRRRGPSARRQGTGDQGRGPGGRIVA